jgi:peptide/nickel transport system ATP-binding protein
MGAERGDDRTEPLLSVEGLEKHYPVRSGLLRRTTGYVKAVDGISFEIREGETVGLVGESGCGKSTAATTMLGLEEPTGGTVRFDGQEVSDHDAADRTEFRRRAGVVFQDPTTAFDPRMTVLESVAEPLEVHGITDPDRRRRLVAELIEHVGLPESMLYRYPDDLSGGEKQRLALARALILNPDLLVADEPVSALDVSVQAEILSLLETMRDELDLSVLLITHDLSVVRQVCDRVAVMYLGEIVELAPVEELFADPHHPYTETLLASIPEPDPRGDRASVEVTGDVPDPADPPSGCRFHPRCPKVIPPDAHEFDDGAFRAVLDLRLDADAGTVSPDEFADASSLRDAYDLPDRLDDPDAEAEAELAAALDVLLDGRTAAAADRLSEAFPTVCEREHPSLRETAADRRAACHRHEE